MLRDAGSLESGRVVDLQVETIGDGVGFAGTVARIHLDCQGAGDSIPTSLIAKLPGTNAKNRAAVEMMGGYEREVCFFQQLAERSELPVPRCLYAAMDPDPLYERRPALQRCIERLPVPLMRGFVSLGRWGARRSGRRYCVLMEDLAPAVAGDQIVGCGLEQAKEVARSLAAFHASFWQDESLAEEIWLTAIDTLPRAIMAIHRRARRRYFRAHRDSLPEHMVEACAWTDAHYERMMRRLASPPWTVLHGDFRLDNFVFGKDRMWVLDFQGVVRGRGTLDLAYFVCGNVHPDVDDEPILEAYCDELARRGVHDYPRAESARDYELAKLFQMYVQVSGEDLIELPGERGVRLLEVYRERVLSRLPKPPYDRLL